EVALSGEEIRHATELRLARAVEEMLERSLGPGRVRAEAAVRMNFDRVNETQERYDPDGQVTRSTQSVTSNSKTVRTLIREQPQIDRISLAVMVDGIDVTAADGKKTWQARPQDELDRITALVRTAIGYDEKRGDHVEIASLRFVAEDGPAAEPAGLLGVKLEKNDFMRLAQTALFGIIGLLALLLVLRPMVHRIT